MGATPAVPQIPDIVVQQAPQQNLQLNDALSQVAAQATAKLPSPYTQEYTQQSPRIQPVRQFTPQNDQQRPLGQGSAQLKHTQNMNALASLSNMVGRAGQAIAQKKQDQLKMDLTDVMQAKQNAENAQVVLQQDPNNKLAQQVLAANKKRLNDILSDPKKQKGLAKALDISFTNPEDNKTPEVQAGQQAMAQVRQAGQYNASNPQEAQVARLAQGGGSITTPNLPAQQGSASFQPPAPPTVVTQSYQGKQVPGLVSQGNLDITKRPNIRNPDGSHSSTFSYSFGFDNGETLVPGVGDGKNYPLRKLNEKEALDQYRKTGQNFGTFKDVKSADEYAEKLHEDQAKFGSTPQQPAITRGPGTPATPSATLPSMGGGSLNVPGARNPNVTQQRSATPYADQAIARDLPSLAANPRYAQALAQRQAAQKAL